MRSREFVALAGVLMLASASGTLAAEYCVSADAGDAAGTHVSIAAALDAASVTDEADVIRIVAGAADAGQALVIAGHDVTLRGGYADCSQTAPGETNTTVSGAGTAVGTSVITIFGPAQVRLEHVDITAGTGLDGGGINYVSPAGSQSKGLLELVHTRVFGNVAGRDGGGIRIASQGGSVAARVQLILAQGTRIDGNRALQNGGGLHLTGYVQLFATATELSFHDNEAVQGDGGAIHLRQPAAAEIASAPWNGEATFLRNRAAGSGGAIYLEAPGASSSSGLMRLYGAVANQPLVFEQNRAGQDGGALKVHGSYGPRRQFRPASVCGSNVNFIANTAGDAAVMSVSYSSYVPCSAPVRPPGVVAACNPFQACNRIEGNRNVSEDARGLMTLEMSYGVLLRSTVVDNQAGNALFHLVGEQTIDFSSDLGMLHTLVADNRLTGSAPALIRSQTGLNGIEMRYSTLAGNVLQSTDEQAASLDFGAGIDEIILDKNIIHQPGTRLLRAGATPNIYVRDLLLHELPDAFPPSASIIAGDPRFAGPGNYQLQNDSPAVDFAPAFATTTLDLAGNARSLDLPERPDVAGPTDLGAFESQPQPPAPLPEAVFADGFEEFF